MTFAQAYMAQVEAVDAQRSRLSGIQPGDDIWATLSPRFRGNPRQELSGTLAAVASYVQPDDVVVDVGGGGGRYSLPLALRCREVINIDPSPGMRVMFQEAAIEAGITNTRFVPTDWLAAGGITGDVVLVSHVTYFVRDIVAFIEKSQAAARRRVVLVVASVPHPNRPADLSRLVHRQDMALVPGHRELLNVLWDMDILPEVHLLGPNFAVAAERVEAIEDQLRGIWLSPSEQERARSLIEAHFEDLFLPTPQGHVLRRAYGARDLLITWETGYSQ